MPQHHALNALKRIYSLQVEVPEGANEIRLEGTLDKGRISDGYHTFDELYAHRHALFIALAAQLPHHDVWRSRLHHDGTGMEGWFVAGIHLRDDDAEWGYLPITYHLPDELWERLDFATTHDRAPHFDGHTANDVLNNLHALTDLSRGSTAVVEVIALLNEKHDPEEAPEANRVRAYGAVADEVGLRGAAVLAYIIVRLHNALREVVKETYQQGLASARTGADKRLSISDTQGAKATLPDLVRFGQPDQMRLLFKASSEAAGFSKSTKAMEIPGLGCLVQVSTLQRNHDGTNAVAEALQFVPEVTIVGDEKRGRKLVQVDKASRSAEDFIFDPEQAPHIKALNRMAAAARILLRDGATITHDQHGTRMMRVAARVLDGKVDEVTLRDLANLLDCLC